MDIKRIIEIASGLNRLCPSHDEIYDLKVKEPLRRAIVKGKLNFVDYLLNCPPEEYVLICDAFEEGLSYANAITDGVIREGYEDAYRLYEMMCEYYGSNAPKTMNI